MELSFYITAFVTLFVVIDPIGLTPLFVALTKGMPRDRRNGVGYHALIIGAILLTLFGLFGEAVLGFVGISMPAFRIAGGILLFLTALDMLFERRTQRRQGQADTHPPDPSVFPLATPLIAGPGAIATMILLTGETGGSFTAILLVHLVMFLVLGLTLALFLMAGLLEKLLGDVGGNVVTRLLGMLLAALSVQFVVDGILALTQPL
jgi:multiple antibiotic resistance protein